jgi:hypothetical protein
MRAKDSRKGHWLDGFLPGTDFPEKKKRPPNLKGGFLGYVGIKLLDPLLPGERWFGEDGKLED